MTAHRWNVFDTETTALFDFSKPADHPNQPRLAHLAMVFLDPDLAVEHTFDVLIKPDGWVLDPGAAAVNGLTMERLEKEGVPVKDALAEYTRIVKAGWSLAAFNAQFDTKVMRGELRRAEMDDLFMVTPNICLMRAMTDVCQIPYANGRAGFKFPKLAEALAHIGKVNDGPHTAGGDARGAVEILRWLSANQMLPEPGVHMAKQKPDGAAPKPRSSAKAKPVAAHDEIPS